MNKKVAMIAGAAIGAGLMYFADPRMGRRRRALVGDQRAALGVRSTAAR
jgi:hypothetical protein